MTLETEAPPLSLEPDGTIRINGTRVTLDTVIGEFRDGSSAEQIVFRYPTLSLADVYAVLGYCLRHSAETNEYLLNREREARTTRQEMEERFHVSNVRSRLLARREQERS